MNSLTMKSGFHDQSTSAKQVPMSKLESDEFINDRYKSIEDRLAVSCRENLGRDSQIEIDLYPYL